GLSVSSFDIPVTTSKYDLLLNVLEEAGGYRIYAEYNNTLFSEARISRLLEHYLRLLEAALQSPDLALDELGCLSEEEHQRLAYGINDHQRHFASYPSLYHLFHEQALLRPDDTALLYSGGQMDYKTLSGQVKSLAAV
ncbi:condensation domain-containing protein, partial [Chitinophaga qingshengii]